MEICMRAGSHTRIGTAVVAATALLLGQACTDSSSSNNGGSGGQSDGGTGMAGSSTTGGVTASGGLSSGTGGKSSGSDGLATGGRVDGGTTGPTGGALPAGGTAGSGDAATDARSDGSAAQPGSSLSGRFNLTDKSGPSFGWSDSAIFARFGGTGATLRMDGSPNQFQVVIDGTALPSVLKVVSGTTQYQVATGLSAGTHELIVWKRTEGNQGDNRFLGLDVVGGQLLTASPAPDRRIEVYGDSITAGYGLDGQNCSGYQQDKQNSYLTYAAVAARALSAELHAVAWSGIGMYRNYNEAGPSTENMPAVYA